MKPSIPLIALLSSMRLRCLLPASALLPAAMLPAAPAVLAAQVDELGPDQAVKTTIDGVMAAMRADAGARAGDGERIYRLVREKFLPGTDFMLSTQYAVGAAWTRATPAQREALFRQFQTLLARTYATQLTQISAEDTRFTYAQAGRVARSDTDAVVKTTVHSGGDTMAIDYRLRRTAAGWKIYDIDMMGAWMIQVYRRQFAAQLQAGGVDGLIRYLAAHNAAP
ncbi:MlaC/ttg2D family ABC transporter substrate-binding protein [Massilia forsythiae]|nr:ABC transporter substrate-binding protein [Massilia forsythiae]